MGFRTEQMYQETYLNALEFNLSENPISMCGGHFAKYPDADPRVVQIPLDVIGPLQGVKMVVNPDGRFALKTRRKIIKTGKLKRQLPIRVNKVQYSFNAANVLASHALGKDVTANSYGMWIDRDGIWVETENDRKELSRKLKHAIEHAPDRVIRIIHRPYSEDIDLTGRGYYISKGVVYNAKHIPMAIRPPAGSIFFTSEKNGKQQAVGLGHVLFSTYPEIYNFNPEFHTDQDHIDGDRTNNVAWNMRPTTRLQNIMARNSTGDIVERTRQTSSDSKFKEKHGTDILKRLQDLIDVGKDIKRYKDTNYFCHRDGVVFVKRYGGGFDYAEVRVKPCGYVYVAGYYKQHVMMMKAFGIYKEGLDVMHLDHDRQNNALKNLMMGTRRENANKKTGLSVTIRGQEPVAFQSIRDAMRVTGIERSTLTQNAKRQRPGSPLVFSTSRGIEFHSSFV
jgi:hypothetical protein